MSDKAPFNEPPPPYQDNEGYQYHPPPNPPQPNQYGTYSNQQYATVFTQQPMPSTTTHNVTVVQHTIAPTVTPPEYAPKDYCGLAWFACLCCCWPFGICAIINSNNASDAILRGDFVSAASYGQSARNYAIAAIICGIGIISTFFLVLSLSGG